MPTPAQVIEAIHDYGVELLPYPFDERPWYDFTTPGGWEPIGIMHHHTVGTADLLVPGSLAQRSMARLLRIGRSDLNGPLCHLAPVYLGPGRLAAYPIGWGNVNHAGRVSGTIVARVREVNTAWDGLDTTLMPGPDSVDGNPLFWGLEYMHPGDRTPWPDELLTAGHRIGAALCDVHGWGPLANIEHREATTRKVDRSWVLYGAGLRRAVEVELRKKHEDVMLTAEEIANAVLDAVVNPRAPAEDQFTVRRRLRQLHPERFLTPAEAKDAMRVVLAERALDAAAIAAAVRQTVEEALAEAEPMPVTEAQIEAACERAVRRVLGGLDNPEE